MYSLLSKMVFFCVALLFYTKAVAQHSVFAIKEQEEETILEGLNAFTKIVEDSSNTFSFQQVQADLFQPKFLPIKEFKSPLNPNYTYWGKIVIQNQKKAEEDWVLQFGERHQTDFVEVFVFSSQKENIEIKKTGYFCPASEKNITIDGVGSTIRLDFKIGDTQTIYFKIKNVSGFSPQLNLKLIQRSTFSEIIKVRALIQGFIQGILLIMIGYNLLIFLINKDDAYLYYTLYMICLSLYFQYFYGYTQTYFLYENVDIAPFTWILSVGVFSVLYFSFLYATLSNQLKFLTSFKKYITAFQIIKSLLVLVLLILYGVEISFLALITRILMVFIPIECCLIFYTSYKLYQSQDITARYFITGSLALYLGILVNLGYFLLMGKHIYAPDCLQVGLFLEILMFSLGLGHRMNLNEKAKHKAQQDLIQQLQTNEKLQATINQELEEKVKERTLEIEKQTEELKKKQEEIVVQSEQLKEANEEIRKVNTNLEYLVNQRTAELKRTNKELDLFLYRSSHDLRGPLTTLLGLVELGYLVQKDKDTYNILDKVKIIVHNMDKTLEKLQMISEIDVAGGRDKTYVDFKTLLHQILEKFHSNILTKGIKIEKNLDIHEPFDSYANLIRIILLNLIENSIMFCYTTEAYIKINLSVKQGVLKIQIIDNGVGIPENFKDKIFEMYVRASEMSKGNGLGLYVTKRAVLKLGGKIYIEESIKGNRITCFTVEIPRIQS